MCVCVYITLFWFGWEKREERNNSFVLIIIIPYYIRNYFYTTFKFYY